jgi:hypothetical protein
MASKDPTSVPVGKTSAAGGTITLLAFATAAVAYWQGARDAVTLSTLATGVLFGLATLGGRHAQAVALALRSSWGAEKSAATAATAPAVSQTASAGTGTNVVNSWDAPRPGAHVTNWDPVAAGRRAVEKHSDALRRLDDEPGDPDALPDYDTTTHPPADVGDEHARPDQEPAP